MSELIQIDASTTTGRRYWRSLEERTLPPQVSEWVEREFPEGATRRAMFKLMAAGMGLAGLTACRRPVEHVLPHSRGIEGYVPGRPLHYATVVEHGGAAIGLLVESNDGRPTKVEGNPRHPESLGSTTAQVQAMILDLYDPDRASELRHGNARSNWDEFDSWWKDESARLGDGAGLRILSERSSSPTLVALKADIAKRYPASRWVEWDSVDADQAVLGAELAFGTKLVSEPLYDQADVILALDCDFLGLDSASARPSRRFAARRREKRNRLYVAESNFTTTGSMADHRLRVRASDVAALALELADELATPGKARKFVAAVARDLKSHAGNALVVAGPRQPAAVHAVVAVINQQLGKTVLYSKPPAPVSDSVADVRRLCDELRSGTVKTLFVLGGNPVYALPADLDFLNAAKRATLIALSDDENETWTAALWRLPRAHAFECWGDARSADGTAAIRQPLIQPLYSGRSTLEIAALIAGSETLKGYELVRRTWLAQWGADGEKRWRKVLFDGFVEGSAGKTVEPHADATKVLTAARQALKPTSPGLEVVFYSSSGVYDGRFANNAWMQEAPDPMTKLVWDNAALVSAATAKRLGIETNDLIEISANGRKVTAPVWIQPGHADDSISLSLGYGRAACGRVGRGVGHRVEGLRTTSGYHFTSAEARKTGGTYKLVATQEHHTLVEPITGEKRDNIVVERRLGEVVEHEKHPATDLFAGFDYSKGSQWGMAIDLDACTGCNACLVACQAENNIPVVGKDEVDRGREMHWIRLDRYFTGDEHDPQTVIQPMACQQCEKAPCESVCPVAATTQSPEGLNEMVYNRCVGTRYCANNCPYKVRRFNFFDWNKHVTEMQAMVFNPDVTVRMRGVMEKCNYCVQRIEEKRTLAKSEGRRAIRDMEILTACQQACPTEAIVFGNVNDPESRVAKAKASPRDYVVIEELNTKPRTTYLARLRNSNPELA
jgi:molybdopterin-containing oxidoreductase family iron-sulfur binding subunit